MGAGPTHAGIGHSATAVQGATRMGVGWKWWPAMCARRIATESPSSELMTPSSRPLWRAPGAWWQKWFRASSRGKYKIFNQVCVSETIAWLSARWSWRPISLITGDFLRSQHHPCDQRRASWGCPRRPPRSAGSGSPKGSHRRHPQGTRGWSQGWWWLRRTSPGRMEPEVSREGGRGGDRKYPRRAAGVVATPLKWC